MSRAKSRNRGQMNWQLRRFRGNYSTFVLTLDSQERRAEFDIADLECGAALFADLQVERRWDVGLLDRGITVVVCCKRGHTPIVEEEQLLLNKPVEVNFQLHKQKPAATGIGK